MNKLGDRKESSEEECMGGNFETGCHFDVRKTNQQQMSDVIPCQDRYSFCLMKVLFQEVLHLWVSATG